MQSDIDRWILDSSKIEKTNKIFLSWNDILRIFNKHPTLTNKEIGELTGAENTEISQITRIMMLTGVLSSLSLKQSKAIEYTITTKGLLDAKELEK